jgi:flagellar basal body rod protein FlgG
MIEPATSAALERIAVRQDDVLHAFQPGFEPREGDAAGRGSHAARSVDPLSVVAPEGAYFVIAGAEGAMRLTRDGCFTLRAGELRASDGDAVLGFAAGGAHDLRPLRAEAADAALDRVVEPRIESDGTVTYARTTVDPRTARRLTARVAIGRIALARLPAATHPVRLDAAHVAPPPGVTPAIGVPGDRTFGALLTQRRDAGRLDAVAGLQRLQEAYLAFDALRAANEAHGVADKTAMDLVK